MNDKTAELLLYGVRRGKPNDPRLEKTVRWAEKRSDFKQRLQEQGDFDDRIVKVLKAIVPPPDIRKRLDGAGAKSPPGRPKFAAALVASAVCGVLVTLGLVVNFEIDDRRRYPGIEAVERMIAAANQMSGIELDPVATGAGDLGDWFYMRGFETYSAPPELASSPAVGSRLFRQDGNPIAQVAVDKHQSLLYVFRAHDFGVQIPPDADWRINEIDGWVAAIRRHDETCYLLIFRGDKKEMKKFLKSLPRAR
jgi:hypothetical protein